MTHPSLESQASIKVVEVGPRDGLQNIATHVPTPIKVALVQKLYQSGVQHIEAGAFVSSKWVPQMSDSRAVFAALAPMLEASPQVLSALVPNEKGLLAALQSGIKEIALFTAASDTFNQKNTNSSLSESLQRFQPIVRRAISEGIKVRAYISCAIHCPFEGFITPEKVVSPSAALLEMGCYEVSLGDTTGKGTPAQVGALISHLTARTPIERLAGHFHDTYGQGIANVFAALELGVRTFDASVGGLGGCPYAPGAAGNLATEDLVYLLHGLGYTTGIDINTLAQTGAWICDHLKTSPSKAGLALTSLEQCNA